MIPKIALAAVALPLAMGSTVIASVDWAVIQVKDKKEGVHFTLPVPLTAIQGAMAFAPARTQLVHTGMPEEGLDSARAALAALRAAEDRELVRVDDGDEHVRIRKAGDVIEIDVTGRRNERVSVRVPLEAAVDALDSMRGGTLDVSRLIDSLRRADGHLVHVRDGDTEVSVRIF